MRLLGAVLCEANLKVKVFFALHLWTDHLGSCVDFFFFPEWEFPGLLPPACGSSKPRTAVRQWVCALWQAGQQLLSVTKHPWKPAPKLTFSVGFAVSSFGFWETGNFKEIKLLFVWQSWGLSYRWDRWVLAASCLHVISFVVRNKWYRNSFSVVLQKTTE